MSSFRLAIPLFLPLVVGLAFLTGACGAPLAVTGASYAADGSLLATSNKTATDHLASMISKKDCALWRAFRGRPVCKEREGDKDPYNVDYTQPQRMVSEDGVQYAPPLRAAPDAPAASWDAAASKAAPTPAGGADGPARRLGPAAQQGRADSGGACRAGDGRGRRLVRSGLGGLAGRA